MRTVRQWLFAGVAITALAGIGLAAPRAAQAAIFTHTHPATQSCWVTDPCPAHAPCAGLGTLLGSTLQNGQCICVHKVVAPPVPGKPPAPAKPEKFKFKDKDGPGVIEIEILLPDPSTHGVRIQIRIIQNGRTFVGFGFMRLVSVDPPHGTDQVVTFMVVFTLCGPRGEVFMFHGALHYGGITGGSYGELFYGFPCSPGDIDGWPIYGYEDAPGPEAELPR